MVKCLFFFNLGLNDFFYKNYREPMIADGKQDDMVPEGT